MIARDYRIPKSTLWDWIQRDQDLITRYVEAQQSRAMHHAHSVEELIEKVECISDTCQLKPEDKSILSDLCKEIDVLADQDPAMLLSEIERKDIRINDYVWVKRAGDVIPYVSQVELSKREKINKRYKVPKICPCKEFTIIKSVNETVQRCNGGNKCKFQKKEGLKHYASKKAMNIDGLGEKQIEKFIELEIIDGKSDIYHIQKHSKKIINLEGYGDKSFQNLISSINESKNTTLARYIFSLGLRHVGENNSELLAQFFQSKASFIKLINSKNLIKDLSNIDGLGVKAVDSFINFFKDEKNKSEAIEIIDFLNIKPIEIEKNSKNKTILFTGTLDTLSRDRAKELAKKNGFKISSSVSKNLDYLIFGEKAGSKLKKAKEIGIKILNEKEFLNLIN